MAESEHDDLADALARLAGGDVAPSEHEPAPPQKPVARPAPVKAAPVATTNTRPPAPGAGVRPAAPIRPSAPMPSAVQAPASSPVARTQRPNAPTVRQIPVETPEPVEYEPAPPADPSEIFDDEDAVIVPAPEPSAFIPKPKSTTTADARAKIAAKKKIEFQRTLIPILLTLGVLMFVSAGIKFCLGPDSPLTALPNWTSVVPAIIGVVLEIFAVMNMLSVKQQMAKI